MDSHWHDPKHRDGRLVRDDGAMVFIGGPTGRWYCRSPRGGVRKRRFFKTAEKAMRMADEWWPMKGSGAR